MNGAVSRWCRSCGHVDDDHDGGGCTLSACDCIAFGDAENDKASSMERIAVALESIAKSLDAMAWEKR